MKRKSEVFFCIIILSLLINACSGTGTDSGKSAREITRDLQVFSRAFALSVIDDRDLQTAILQEANLRFDGDRDVLYRTISSFPVVSEDGDSRGFKTLDERLKWKLASLLAGSRSTEDPGDVIDAIPDLNIYCYQPDSSDDNLAELVVPIPYDVDVEAVPSIMAYDGEGRELLISTVAPPEFATFVIGINERLNTEPIQMAEGKAPMGNGHYILSTKYKATSKDALREGWLLGNPEIYQICIDDLTADGTLVTIKDLEAFNKTSYTPSDPITMFRWQPLYGGDVGSFFLEDDSDLFGGVKEISIKAGYSPKAGTGEAGFSVELECTAETVGKKFTTADDYCGNFIIYTLDDTANDDPPMYSTGSIYNWLE